MNKSLGVFKLSFFRYLIKRVGWSLFVIIGVSIVIFMVARVVPGDPARMALGPRAPEEVVEKLRTEMHLDEPVHIQYWFWLKKALQGDFGYSLLTKRPVATDIKDFAPATLELVIFAAILGSSMGLFLGIISAMHANRWIDNAIRVSGYVAVATPAFVVAIFLMLIFGYWLHFLPTIGGRLSPDLYVNQITGMILIDSLIQGNIRAFFDALAHIILPAIALVAGGMAQETRITRSNMLENADKDYISLLRSQGIPNRIIMGKYLLKPSVIPTVSIIGLDFASLIGNAFLVEMVFNWPGLSRYGITAMLNKDLNAVSAVVVIIGIIFIVTNILVDLIVSLLDPRIRLQERA